MLIADNIIRHHLRNMYFLAGTACGGKTTMSRTLAEKHGLPLYRELTNRAEHQQFIEPAYQPALAQQFEDWNEYFSRPPTEYAAWLRGTLVDDFPMVVIDLIAHYSGQPLVVDYHVLPELARGIINRDRIVFLVTDPLRAAKENITRADHREIYDCIMTLPDPEAKLANLERTMILHTEQFLRELEGTDWYVITRGDTSTVEGTLALIERHFGLTRDSIKSP